MKRTFKMTEVIYEQIRQALLQGKVGCEIASDFGCSQATVQRIRNDIKKEGRNLWYNVEKGGYVSMRV